MLTSQGQGTKSHILFLIRALNSGVRCSSGGGEYCGSGRGLREMM